MSSVRGLDVKFNYRLVVFMFCVETVSGLTTDSQLNM